MEPFLAQPIGVFRSETIYPFEAARQPRPDDERSGTIQLFEGHNFEQALLGLADFERVWVIFQFHHNANWKPMVRPPRGTSEKRGVFATRAPYRPNAIGLSCVRLGAISGRTLRLIGSDLLDGTPILDIKPYIPEADAFPGAKVGWLENIESRAYRLEWSTAAEEKLEYLKSQGLTQLRDFITQQLEYEPFDEDRKRLTSANNHWTLAYRTWRIHFAETTPGQLKVTDMTSGYTRTDLESESDKWQDKQLHRDFTKKYGE